MARELHSDELRSQSRHRLTEISAEREGRRTRLSSAQKHRSSGRAAANRTIGRARQLWLKTRSSEQYRLRSRSPEGPSRLPGPSRSRPER